VFKSEDDSIRRVKITRYSVNGVWVIMGSSRWSRIKRLTYKAKMERYIFDSLRV
jgi:hypothetical protein